MSEFLMYAGFAIFSLLIGSCMSFEKKHGLRNLALFLLWVAVSATLPIAKSDGSYHENDHYA